MTKALFRTHEIPASAVEALSAAKAKGHRIFIATGRPRVIINNLGPLQERGLIDGYVTMNGAYCFVGDKVIYKSSIPADDVRTLTDYCAQRSIPCIVVGEHTICVCQPATNTCVSRHPSPTHLSMKLSTARKSSS